MDIMIREERIEEYNIIYNLIKEAFKTAKVKDGTEQDYANALRNSEAYIDRLALVAEYNNEIIGQIMFTRFNIKMEDSIEEILLLAPLSVLEKYRDIKVGTRLIEEGFKRARELKYKGVILVGDPNYYGRFGFKKSIDYNIKNISGFPDENILIVELIEDSLKNINGIVEF